MSSQSNTQNRTRRTQVDRREIAEIALFEAAIALIADHGVKRTTLAEVGAAAGYSRGLAGHYFKTKDRLLQATAEYAHQRYAEQLADKNAKPGLETLLQIVELSCTKRSLEIAKAMYLMQKEAFFDTAGLADVIKKFNRDALRRVENEISAGVSKGEIRKDIKARAAAVVLLGLIRGIPEQLFFSAEKVKLSKIKRELTQFVARNFSIVG
jgi:AcrR family transcriptional regulator